MKHHILIYSLVILVACRKDKTPAASTTNDPSAITANAAPDINLVWMGNEKNIQVFEAAATDWNSTPVFNFVPTTARNWSSSDVTNWNGPSDCKVRNMPGWGGNWFVSSGGSMVLVGSYPAGEKKWSVNLGSGINPHSAELLPTGNVAVAGTDGNWVRVYAASANSTANGSFPLVSAHSVLWDPGINRLWAIGKDHLVALTVGGTNAAPTLTEDTDRRGNLPRPFGADKPAWGHDISFDPNDANIIWVSINGGVYSFNKTTRAFTEAPGSVNMTFVKGISRLASGVFVVTRPDNVKTPVPADPVLDPTWCTRYVDFYSATGSFLYSRKRNGASIYKGKALNMTAPVAALANGKYRIVSRLSGKAAVVQLASMEPGASVITYDYTETNDNDEWNVTQIGNSGYYRITNVKSGLDMAVLNASFGNSAEIIQHTYTSAAPVNDEWAIMAVGNGYYAVVSRYSNKVLNVKGASMENNVSIIQYPYSNVPQSQWAFEPVP